MHAYIYTHTYTQKRTHKYIYAQTNIVQKVLSLIRKEEPRLNILIVAGYCHSS